MDGIPITTLREIVILKELENENFVKLIDIDAFENKLYLIFEYINKDLRQYIDQVKPSEMIKSKIIKNISCIRF